MNAFARTPESQGYDDRYFERPYFTDHPGKRRSSDHIIRQLCRSGLSAGRVLDIGSGPGYVLRSLAEAGYTAAGLDHSEEAIRRAASLMDGLDLRQADVCRQIPWPDDHFDGVVLRDVIEHLSEPEAAMDEVRRVLRPGGIALVSTLNARSVLHKLLGKRWSFYQDPTHLKMYDRKSLEELVRKSGLTPVDVWTFFDLNTAGETTRWLGPLRRLAFVFYVPRWGESVTIVARKP